MKNQPVTFHIEVAAGARESVCLRLSGRLPFMPQVGMMIVAVKGDDFREVEEVYWSAESGLEVYFVFEDASVAGTMKQIGWTEDEE